VAGRRVEDQRAGKPILELKLIEDGGSVVERSQDAVTLDAPAGLAMTRLLFLVQRDPVLRSILALPTPVPSFVMRAAVARLYLQLAFASPRSIELGVISAFTWHHRDRARVASYLELAHRLLPELQDPYELERISTRVLLVWGDRDRLVFHRGADRVLDIVPEANLELLRGIGHCPQVEAPERFTELLLGFGGEVQTAAA